MKLSALLSDSATLDARLAAVDASGVTADSRSVKRGDVFVAVPGTKADGMQFAAQAAAAGAAAVVGERTPASPLSVPFVQVANVRRALALASPRPLLPSPAPAARPRLRPSRGRYGKRSATRRRASAPSAW